MVGLPCGKIEPCFNCSFHVAKHLSSAWHSFRRSVSGLKTKTQRLNEHFNFTTDAIAAISTDLKHEKSDKTVLTDDDKR
jgi:hypothetical protein